LRVSGCGVHESDVHLFLTCGFFGHIWQLVRYWLGVHSAYLSNIVDHFLQFGISSGHVKSRRSFMFLVWFGSSCVVWKKRNARIFWVTYNSPSQLLESIKLLSYFPSSGIKLILLFFIISFMTDVGIHFYVWESANLLSFCLKFYCNLLAIFSGTPCVRG